MKATTHTAGTLGTPELGIPFRSLLARVLGTHVVTNPPFPLSTAPLPSRSLKIGLLFEQGNPYHTPY